MPQLTHAQQMVLQFGPDPRWADAFRTEEECCEAWARARDELLAGYPPGRRPQAWWRYDAGELRFPGLDAEQATLWEAGLLSETERAELECSWRREFTRAHDRNFFHCESGRILKGAAARRAQYRWAGIPPDLLKRWTRERRRQSRTIRGFAQPPAAEPPPAA